MEVAVPPVRILVQVLVPFGGEARWSFAAVRLLSCHSLVSGSALCGCPWPESEVRRIRLLKILMRLLRLDATASTTSTGVALWGRRSVTPSRAGRLLSIQVLKESRGGDTPSTAPWLKTELCSREGCVVISGSSGVLSVIGL